MPVDHSSTRMDAPRAGVVAAHDHYFVSHANNTAIDLQRTRSASPAHPGVRDVVVDDVENTHMNFEF